MSLPYAECSPVTTMSVSPCVASGPCPASTCETATSGKLPTASGRSPPVLPGHPNPERPTLYWSGAYSAAAPHSREPLVKKLAPATRHNAWPGEAPGTCGEREWVMGSRTDGTGNEEMSVSPGPQASPGPHRSAPCSEGDWPDRSSSYLVTTQHQGGGLIHGKPGGAISLA